MKALLLRLVIVCTVLAIPMFGQALPDASVVDPTGDASEAWIDYSKCYFVQQGDSLFIGITMDGLLSERIPGYSTNTFFTDIDDNSSTGQGGSRVGSDNNFTFVDLGDGTWWGNFYVNYDSDPAFNGFKNHVVLPVTIHTDGKTMYTKISLVGTGWEELIYDLNGWYKDGSTWHQVPHLPGDMMDDLGLCEIDISAVTALVEKVGTDCIVKVPEPYSTTADTKDIIGVVDEMVAITRTEIGTIADNTRKYAVGYENFADYAHPIYYSSSRPNQFGSRIPGQYWVDEPNWFAMLDGAVNLTLNELSAGLREIFLMNSYARPIPGSNEGWYCTADDSINGFKWAFQHKSTMKALMGTAFENCYVFHIADGMTDGEAKTAILAKKAELITAYESYTGIAEDLTPEIMTGLLLSLTDDLSWTTVLFEEIIPTDFDTADSTNTFVQVVNNYIRHEDFAIRSSDDFLTQAHHAWYGLITAIQTAAIELASGEDLYTVLAAITDFPIDTEIYNDVKALLSPEDPYTIDDTVPYVWNDISTVGTEIPRADYFSQWTAPDVDDGCAGPIGMGISFEFYDAVFDSIYIGINGICSFTDPVDWITSGSYGSTIPGMGWDNILCPLACDIMGDRAYSSAPYNTATGTIYYYYDSVGDNFTIQYHNMTEHHYVVDEACPDTTLQFQVVLNASDGSITYYYKDLGIAPEPVAKRATVGIQPGKDSFLGKQYYGGNSPVDGYPVNGSAIKFSLPTVGVEGEDFLALPKEPSLAQNYPNPFNPTTIISFKIPNRSNVSLVIYDILGQTVATLLDNQVVERGFHEFQWNASGQSSGMYLYQLKIDGHSAVKKCLYLK